MAVFVKCWDPCYGASSHAVPGVVRAGVTTSIDTGVRINCNSPGQLDVGSTCEELARKEGRHSWLWLPFGLEKTRRRPLGANVLMQQLKLTG